MKRSLWMMCGALVVSVLCLPIGEASPRRSDPTSQHEIEIVNKFSSRTCDDSYIHFAPFPASFVFVLLGCSNQNPILLSLTLTERADDKTWKFLSSSLISFNSFAWDFLSASLFGAFVFFSRSSSPSFLAYSFTRCCSFLLCCYHFYAPRVSICCTFAHEPRLESELWFATQSSRLVLSFVFFFGKSLASAISVVYLSHATTSPFSLSPRFFASQGSPPPTWWG